MSFGLKSMATNTRCSALVSEAISPKPLRNLLHSVKYLIYTEYTSFSIWLLSPLSIIFLIFLHSFWPQYLLCSGLPFTGKFWSRCLSFNWLSPKSKRNAAFHGTAFDYSHADCCGVCDYLNPFSAISQNGQTHTNNSSANCRRIVWVCLTILWDWRVKG